MKKIITIILVILFSQGLKAQTDPSVEVSGYKIHLLNGTDSIRNNAGVLERRRTDGIFVPQFTLPTSSGGDVETSYILGLQALGSQVKAIGLGCPNMNEAGSSIALGSAIARYEPIRLNVGNTITGVKVLIRTAGVYTASNFNGAALYSISGGTLTRIAISNSTDAIWTSAAGFVSIPFTSPITLTSGVYYVQILYNSSAQTTAPSIAYSLMSNPAFDLTNSNVLSGSVGSTTTPPSSISTSSLFSITSAILVMLY